MERHTYINQRRAERASAGAFMAALAIALISAGPALIYLGVFK